MTPIVASAAVTSTTAAERPRAARRSNHSDLWWLVDGVTTMNRS